MSLAGCLLLPQLPVKLMPSRELPTLRVEFSMPGNSSRVVEQEVTGRLEGALARIKGVKRIESRSGNGYGSIRLELDKHTDIDMARLEASTIVRRMWQSFPEGTTYPVVSAAHSHDNSSGPFMTYTVTAPGSSMEIEAYVSEKVVPVLSDILGVERVAIYGVVPMEWHLEYDADRLGALGITTNDLTEAIQRHYKSEFLGVGEVDGNRMRIVGKSTGDRNVFEPAEIPLVTPKGEAITLDKVVTVTHTEGTPDSYFRINGLNSIYLNLTAAEDANQLKVGDEVARCIDRLRRKAPAGMSFLLANDNTDTIRKELDKIYFRTGLTVLILLVFIVIVTRNVRYTLLTVISLAINLAVAVIFYRFFSTEIQLYSLAGITISLNLVIDNTIVMCDHYMRRRDRRAFPAILAATLTTAGALIVVFLLNDEIKRNLEDFVIVVVVNLLVSLIVALFLVPALAERMGCVKAYSKAAEKRGKHRLRSLRRRVTILLRHLYGGYIRFALRWRWAFFLLMAGGIGCTGWLFFDKVREGGYFNRDYGEKMLYVTASLPNGATIAQMDNLMRRMETFLASKEGIRQFQTNVQNGRQGQITIRFTDEAGSTSLPYRLKSDIVSKALTLGGGSWSVYGLEDNAFNNSVIENSGSMRVKMYGFNYDDLWNFGEQLRDSLLSHRRIKEVEMKSDFSFWKEDYTEFTLTVDREALARNNLTAQDFYGALRPVFGRNIECGYIQADGYTEKMVLSSSQSRDYDVWALLNAPLIIAGRSYKVADFARFEKTASPQDIVKENQSYRLCLQFEYIGSSEQGNKLLKRLVEKFNRTLPKGYKVEIDSYDWDWNNKDYTRYFVLLIIAAIIFFISAVLFNSLLRPLAIIAIIPMSYVGIFLTFWLFELKFDQGGFASFILLSGITVNAAIYIINEFDSLRLTVGTPGRIAPARAVTLYLKAFGVKLMPIIMTVLSTVLGFIPFLVGTSKESFWFPLAAGTIGGLLFSLVALVLYLPLLLLRRVKRPGRTKRAGRAKRWRQPKNSPVN